MERALVTGPGTPMVWRPRRAAARAVTREPLRCWASMTTVPRVRAAITRFRRMKRLGVGWLSGGSSPTTRPCSAMRPMSPAWPRGYGVSTPQARTATVAPCGGEGAAVGRAVDAVGGAGDDDPALSGEAGGEVGRDVGAVRGAGAGADEGDGAQGPGPQVGGAPDPEAERAGVAEVVELPGPFDVAGDEEASAEPVHGVEVAGGVGGGGASSPAVDACGSGAGEGVVAGVEEPVEEADGSVVAEPAAACVRRRVRRPG